MKILKALKYYQLFMTGSVTNQRVFLGTKQQRNKVDYLAVCGKSLRKEQKGHQPEIPRTTFLNLVIVPKNQQNSDVVAPYFQQQ